MVAPALVIIAAAGAAFWLLGRSQETGDRGDPTVPDVVINPPEANPETGEIKGTAETASKQKGDLIDQQESMVLSTAASGAAVAGPIGAVAGAFIGGVINFIRGDTREPLIVPRPCAQESLAGGKLSILVPGHKDFAATQIDFEEAALRELYPGPGAFEACRRSGMFRWRPGDDPTPFSDLLYETASWLPGLEQTHLFPTLDSRSGEVKKLWRAGALDVPGEPADYRRSVILGLAITHHATRYRFDHQGNDIGRWYAETMWNIGIDWPDTTLGSPGPRSGVGRLFADSPHDERKWFLVDIAVRSALGEAGVRVTKDQLSAYEVSGEPRIKPLLTRYPDRRDDIRRGFPGAWRFVPLTQAAGTTLPRELPLSVQTTTVRTTRTARRSLRDAFARGESIAPLPAPVADQENAFAFQVWFPGEVYTDTSARCASVFGSHAAAKQALIDGRLAWNPKSNPPEVKAKWLAIRPYSYHVNTTSRIPSYI